MNENRSGEPETGVSVMLLICDIDGRVRAVSSEGAFSNLFSVDPLDKHFTEVFGAGSEIAEWLTGQIDEVRNQDHYKAESCLVHAGKKLAISLEGLRNGEALDGFAIMATLDSCVSPQAKLDEGDAIVTRQQWHDIKNHLGGLKLYATFLNRKLPPSEERQTVERMLHGINVLIEHLAKIRRGESQ
jgi:hypothetical protein